MKTKKLVTKLLKQIQVLRHEQRLMFEKIQAPACDGVHGCGETVVIPAEAPTGTPVRVDRVPLSFSDVQVDRLPVAVGIRDEGTGTGTEKAGLELLFDKSPMYRHKCVKCKHVSINRQANGMQCNKCGSAMTSALVQPTGKRRRKNRVKVSA